MILYKIFFITTLTTMLIIVSMYLVSAAHYITGIVNDAFDGTRADNHTILLWNTEVGMDDNLTDIIGASGNSNADNIYLIDCESLSQRCKNKDNISLMVLDNGDLYTTFNITMNVTTGGFNVAPNLTLNSPPIVLSIIIDDAVTSPVGEIDLVPASTQSVTCEAVILEYENETDLQSARAEFFYNSTSSPGASDDNNTHYTNESCSIDKSYGSLNESLVECSFDVFYYANAGTWSCFVEANDSLSHVGNSSNSSNYTTVNTLLAVEINTLADFGLVNVEEVSNETEINVSNVGNIGINLSLSGFASSQDDNLSMNCSLGNTRNISVYYAKFNLSESNPGILSLAQFESSYQNLTSVNTIKEFNLNQRQNDAFNEAINVTYWRMFVPRGVAGTCSGNIQFSATQGVEA